MKTCFIFNPHSGKNRRNPELVPAIATFIAAHQLDAKLVSTEAPGHATALARAAVTGGCTRVIAVGGDGTMNEVAQALIGTSAALGLVPCGSGNGLALHLGIPTTPRQALALLAIDRSRIAAIDTGTANGHPFCNAMGLGFDAEISRRFNRLTHRGLTAYARTGLAAFARHRTEQCVVVSNGRRQPVAAFIIAVANSDQYGNHARIAPGGESRRWPAGPGRGRAGKFSEHSSADRPLVPRHDRSQSQRAASVRTEFHRRTTRSGSDPHRRRNAPHRRERRNRRPPPQPPRHRPPEFQGRRNRAARPRDPQPLPPLQLP